jgi:hypothetical protein
MLRAMDLQSWDSGPAYDDHNHIFAIAWFCRHLSPILQLMAILRYGYVGPASILTCLSPRHSVYLRRDSPDGRQSQCFVLHAGAEGRGSNQLQDARRVVFAHITPGFT